MDNSVCRCAFFEHFDAVTVHLHGVVLILFSVTAVRAFRSLVAFESFCHVQILDVIGHAAFGYEFSSLTCSDYKVTVAFHSILTGVGLS